MRIILTILFLLSLAKGFSNVTVQNMAVNDGEWILSIDTIQSDTSAHDTLFIPINDKRSKLIAVAMAILTGPIGGHRLYLGTQPHVPLVYAFTLGGGMGLLPLIDIFVILFSKDLNQLHNNPQVIMWGNGDELKSSEELDSTSYN